MRRSRRADAEHWLSRTDRISYGLSFVVVSWLVLPPLAVVAGALSVTTPCCLPMIPSYLSYISTTGDAASHGERIGRRAALRASLLFVAGFGLVFTALGASLGLIGPTLVRALPQAERVAGVFVIAIGLHLSGLLPIPDRRDRRNICASQPATTAHGFVLGMAFAIGFVPTLGPVLGTVLTLASGQDTVLLGTTLLGLYSLGFGIPFIAMAIGLERASGSIRLLQRHLRRLQILGGLLLVAVGVLFVTGVWRTFFIPVAAWLSRLGWPPI